MTQSTVSMRIHALEDELAAQLLTRGRNGAQLTPAGVRFHRYALSIAQVWKNAQQDVAIPSNFRASFGVGAQFSLWERLILHWIPWMREQAPDVMLRAETDYSDSLMEHLQNGELQVGVMYGPRNMPGLTVETLLEEKLILVSTKRRRFQSRLPDDYIYVDWGALFKTAHNEAFPSANPPALSVSLGELGLRLILDRGGSGYFPIRVVRPLLQKRALYRVASAPVFRRPAYVVYPDDAGEDEVLQLALAGLRHIAARESED